MNTQTAKTLVTGEVVPEDQRMAITERLFGIHFPLELEPIIYGITDRMAEKYTGGYWDFFMLGNGGFYMAPTSDESFEVTCRNQYRGVLSADALGITACLYAYSNLSFSLSDIAREYARHYHLLRACTMEHPEVRGILGATD